MLEAGTKAPSFSLPDQNGQVHTLEEYRGKKVVLYFYPKDNTPGCTKQACNFGELYPQFQEKGAVVVGVSKDSVGSHKKFEEKYGLPFTLLSDPELSCIQAYDVWQEKKNYGKVSMGVVRTTYLIDEKGVIVKAFGKVKAADNPDLRGALLAEEHPEKSALGGGVEAELAVDAEWKRRSALEHPQAHAGGDGGHDEHRDKRDVAVDAEAHDAVGVEHVVAHEHHEHHHSAPEEDAGGDEKGEEASRFPHLAAHADGPVERHFKDDRHQWGPDGTKDER